MAEPEPATALTPVGGSGTVKGIIVADGEELAEGPIEFVARTSNV